MAKVLLADDSVTIHKVVEIILTAKGFTLKAVDNGQSALEELESFRPDVVLADIDMPALNGYELAEKINERPETSNIPVILLAGAFENVDEERMRSSGAVGKLTKPFESEDLIGKINEVLSPEAVAAAEAEDEAEPSETLQVEGLEAAVAEDEGLELAEAAEESEALEAMPGMSGLEPGEESEELTALELEAEAAEAPEPAEPEAVMAELAEELAEEPGEAVAEEPEVAPAEARAEEPELTGVEAPESPAAPTPLTAAVDAEDISRAIREAAGEKFQEFLRSDAVTAMLSDTIEKVLWEITPELAEKLIQQALKDSMASLSKELETIMWETVPDLADSLIRAEIKKIREET